MKLATCSQVKLVFPDEQGLLLGDTGWFPGALGYRFIFEASTQNVERYVLLDTMPQAGEEMVIWGPGSQKNEFKMLGMDQVIEDQGRSHCLKSIFSISHPKKEWGIELYM